MGEIEEAAGVYTQTKIEEFAERKLRFDKPELAQEWDKIQRRERQALIPTIENTFLERDPQKHPLGGYGGRASGGWETEG